METNPKLVEELQAGLAAKLNAIPALPADVNPKLARPGFARGFKAGLGDAKLAAIVVDFATNVALALSGDLAILAEQAGATALRGALARFKSMPVFLPATIGAGGGFARLPKAVTGAGEAAAAAKAAQADGAAAGAARGGAAEEGVKLTGKAKDILKDPALRAMKDISVADALRARGGAGLAKNKISGDLLKKPLGEVANMAAKGDDAADTAIKLVKQAAAKAQKYGGK